MADSRNFKMENKLLVEEENKILDLLQNNGKLYVDYNLLNYRFAVNVKKIAEEKLIKIGDLELFLGLHLGYFSRIRKGTAKHISLMTALAISNIFGMTIEDIINYQSKDELIEERLKKIAFDSILEDFRVDDVIDYLKGLKNE